MNADGLLAKAGQAAASARLLLESGDTDGACNRAYYALFDAARAALLAADLPPEAARTHGGLISAFSLHLVKNGRVSVELGKSLNKAEELRLIADYKGDLIDREDAAWVVEAARMFVDAVRALVLSGGGQT